MNSRSHSVVGTMLSACRLKLDRGKFTSLLYFSSAPLAGTEAPAGHAHEHEFAQKKSQTEKKN